MIIYHNELVRFGNGKVYHIADKQNNTTYCGKVLKRNADGDLLHIDEEKNVKCVKCDKSSPFGFNGLSEIYAIRKEKQYKDRLEEVVNNRENIEKRNTLMYNIRSDAKEALEAMGAELIKEYEYNNKMIFKINNIKIDVFVHI